MALHVVLHNPEIPQNTGNIMRTCAGTGTFLHLIEPLGFSLEEKYLKRSAANYLEHVNYKVYPDWETFLKENKGVIYYTTRYGEKSPDQADFSDIDEDYYIVFGAESSGIPKEILKDNLDNCLRLPMNEHLRSLNLSNVVAVMVYEGLRQQNYRSLSTHEPEIYKGKDFLKG